MGPLHGIKIIEMAGIGPGPMAAMLLADLGATVIRIDRATPSNLGIDRPLKYNFTFRNRKCVPLDLKAAGAAELVLKLVEQADGLIEGFRPGVMERLGLGPDVCLTRNPRLIYGRMTGWGQTGPMANAVGHDLNYIALSGTLGFIGREGQPPTPPLNVIGDMGGGALYLALGMVAAMMEARQSGKGQVVDAAITDGAASLASSVFGLNAGGQWNAARGTNILDSGSYFYDLYECADGKWLSVGAIEKKFHDELFRLLGMNPVDYPPQSDQSSWKKMKGILGAKFKEKTRDEWVAHFGDAEVCVAPLLSAEEAAVHPHNKARGTFVEIDGVLQPAPAPRFSRTQADLPDPPQPMNDENSLAALGEWLDSEDAGAWLAASKGKPAI